MTSFTWVAIYEELAKRLLDYEHKSGELVQLLEASRARGRTRRTNSSRARSGWWDTDSARCTPEGERASWRPYSTSSAFEPHTAQPQ